MSLQDSLFLDPVPSEVWIAYRTDGIKGSGTLLENNVMELSPLSSSNAPGALNFAGMGHISPYVFKNISLRGNIARSIEGGTMIGYVAYGVRVDSCEKALVEANLIDLAGAPQIQHSASGPINYFDNQTPSGHLIQGTDAPSKKQVDELTTRIDEEVLF